MNNIDTNRYLSELLKGKIPPETKKMILNLDSHGKQAIVDYYNENSDFHQHADISNNVYKFGVNTDIHTKIYHYTTFSSLKQILSSKYFRLKPSDLMNDPNDFRWASKLGKDILADNGANNTEIDKYEGMINSQPFKDSYVWSFTENGESQALFNVYGNKEGLSLEFDLPDVMRILATHNAHGKESLKDFTDGDAYTFPLKIEYNKTIQEQYIKPVVLEWLAAFRSYEKDPIDMKEIMLNCSQNMFLFNMAFKDPLLYQEEEIRFVVLRISQLERDPELIIRGVPYTICELTNDLIKSIKIQTGNSLKINEASSSIKKLGYNIEILNSALPY
ncbi:hypothetical protein LDJ81_12470 [Lentilactobacillus parabuchneri]|uniref:hypothetical protein n=1 Tax=Lentilactobacillus parabuchneri TaxID=152331 RepID=UPI0022357952|nr:hypothetical protein [Lentilactobacillus parabuchneri]MCW4399794.1 hypothetical protein [Lentilactobacillus parabuchneri]